jgi:hypothetical protein
LVFLENKRYVSMAQWNLFSCVSRNIRIIFRYVEFLKPLLIFFSNIRVELITCVTQEFNQTYCKIGIQISIKLMKPFTC